MPAAGWCAPSTSPGRQRSVRSWSTGWSAPTARCSRSPRPCARPRTSSRSSGRCSTPTPSRSTRAGRRCRTSGSARAATPSAAGSRSCAGCRTPTSTTAGSRSSWHRSARCCSRRSRGSATSSPSSWCPARPRPWRTSCSGSPTRRTPASTWSRGAASSRSGAASSTSSRPPRSTRCGWSSGATTSRRSAASPSQTSARTRPSTGTVLNLFGRRRAASCCSPTTYAAARGSSASSTPSWSSSPTRSPPASPPRAWRR